MIRGDRFEIDLDPSGNSIGAEQSAHLPGVFVRDVLERHPTAAKPPTAPTLKSKTGFPEHRRRPREDEFQQQQSARGSQEGVTVSRSPPTTRESVSGAGGDARTKSWEEEEKDRIDRENQQKLAEMSPAEIEAEREELMSSLSPIFIQKLLRRSNIESGSNETNLAECIDDFQPRSNTNTAWIKESDAFAEPHEQDEKFSLTPEESKDRGVAKTETLPHDSVHFPRPPQPPDLDPSSETFFQDLHEKYFPSLPSDPEKLEWMQSSTSSANGYDPSAAALSAADLRFSFRGELIPPRAAQEIPVTAGLHHHGDAPDAAGYTLSELTLLARSTYAAQRCIAFQTLGRFLYRLGKGEFGDPGEAGADAVGAEDTFGELARGLWREVEKEKIVETLVTESEGKGVDRGKHVSAKAYATEAVWLWQKGGGRRWKAR